ncbi:MAG: hypothetical protein IKH84_06555, partial [Ottowia sp.]|nr:hypothetical protein [Ottowia sp.]
VETRSKQENLYCRQRKSGRQPQQGLLERRAPCFYEPVNAAQGGQAGGGATRGMGGAVEGKGWIIHGARSHFCTSVTAAARCDNPRPYDDECFV